MLSQEGLKRPQGWYRPSTNCGAHATRNLTVVASMQNQYHKQQQQWQWPRDHYYPSQNQQFQVLPCAGMLQDRLIRRDRSIRLRQEVRLNRTFSLALLAVLSAAFHIQVFSAPTAAAAELLESSIQAEGNVPSELSAAGEQQGPRLSSLMEGSNRKQIEGCTRRCVPTCIRGGEGSPGLGPISLRKEIVVFKDGFRSRQYCLSECAQVCKMMSDTQQQEPQQQKQKQQ